MTSPQPKTFTESEFQEVWEQAYEDVRDLMEGAALLLPTLEKIRQGVLGADETPRRRTTVRTA